MKELKFLNIEYPESKGRIDSKANLTWNEIATLLTKYSCAGENDVSSVVSLSLANQKAIEYAKLKHSDEYNDPAYERDISETELDFARGFVACSEHLKANEGQR